MDFSSKAWSYAIILSMIRISFTSSLFLASPGRNSLRRFCASSSSSSSDLDDLLNQVLQDPTHLCTNKNETSPNSQAATADLDRWRRMNWKAHAALDETSEIYGNIVEPSPIEIMEIQDRMIYIKRDDRLQLPDSNISGNKARKLWTLNQLAPSDFPSCIVSYGGPQSNAMVALAAIVHSRNQNNNSSTRQHGQDNQSTFKFVYYTKKLPRFLRESKRGNLFRAISLGMELVELSNAEYQALFASDSGGMSEPPPTLAMFGQQVLSTTPSSCLWVPQGGASGVALAGARRLAKEIWDFWAGHGPTRPLTVCLPGGTCSTAVLLHVAIQELKNKSAHEEKDPLDICVVVIPCVGDESYSQRQMMALNAELGFSHYGIPTILPPVPPSRGMNDVPQREKYYRFGEPCADILKTYQNMKENHDLLLDLLYGAPSWTILLRHLSFRQQRRSSHRIEPSFDPRYPFVGRCVMYVHSGGLEGIETQLQRYRYKGILKP